MGFKVTVEKQHAFSPVQAELIQRAFNSSALTKHQSGLAILIDLNDAWSFWECEDMLGDELKEVLDGTTEMLKECMALVFVRPITMPNGQYVRPQDIKQIRETHEFMLHRFKSILRVMLNEKRG